MLWLRLFLPFAAGYFLSYLYRTVNAVIGPLLGRELALPDNALGLLTSTYFLAFGLAQLPLGVLLDRFGPRRVESALLLIAAAGAAVFARADGLEGLAVGRALIGLGVSACLMGSFKAFSQWFPLDRQASLTGWVMAAGGLGALVAAKPLELALGFVSWRAVCLGLAAATALVAGLIWLTPDKPATRSGSAFREQLAGLGKILVSPHFWRHAPAALFIAGGFLAVQGLWASRWMNVVEGLPPAAVADRLTWMSLAMLAGFLFMGFFATPLVRRGVDLEKIYLIAMGTVVITLALLVAWPQLAGDLLWPLFCAGFSLSTISYSLVAKAFPDAWSGRANTALNLFLFAGAFGLQWGVGALVDGLQAAGWAASAAYRAAFGLLLAGMVTALTWLLMPRRAAAD